MDISFTKEEYYTLVEMLYLADWVANAHVDEAIKTNDEYTALRMKIYSYYKEMGAEDLIEEDKVEQEYYESAAFEDKMHDKMVDKYNENVFWEELIERLTLRDIVNKIGEETFQSLPEETKIKLLDEKSEHYATEFERNGIKNIKIESNMAETVV